ncbi:protein S-acyltransferase 11 isoform X2 [Dendrobium catenatum]|uniref:protein S-acyltransferase 11 isoform X2 n=1 Tax=Dendrobium catenatum TaxID=906689 RepID=UPI0010A0270D|nr:protein S-acyltransferase 11 isoform X2 [Dendrobium catenatum]
MDDWEDKLHEIEAIVCLNDDHHVTSILEDHERICWGCGLRLLLATYSPVFKCGWCGAITTQIRARKPDSVCFSRWRCFRDQFFVVLLLLFMSFVICVWAVYPTIFSISYFCGVFHSTITAILSFITISSFCMAAFKSAGAPVTVTWGSYPVVGKNDLENYTFCTYCEKPKPPRAHHCRSCRMCVLDMDHHCPFIGNCVGAANHRHFIIFLISVVISCFYVVTMSSYTAFQIWPPQLGSSASTDTSAVSRVVKQIITGIASSVLLLSVRGLVLLYLAFACLSADIGIAVLLWQQLYYIYEGKTYITHISSQNTGNGGCQNILRFFSCPHWAFKIFQIPANSAKLQESSSKVL